MPGELLPCPFCGGEPNLALTGAWYSIVCTTLGCEVIMDDFNSRDDAIAAWNRREEKGGSG